MASITRQKISLLTKLENTGDLGESDLLYISHGNGTTGYQSTSTTISNIMNKVKDFILKSALSILNTLMATRISLNTTLGVLLNYMGNELITAQAFVNSSVNFIKDNSTTITDANHNRVPCLAIVTIEIPDGTGESKVASYTISIGSKPVISESYKIAIGTISKELYLSATQNISVTATNGVNYQIKYIPLASDLHDDTEQ